jgi:hypothetical protein
VATLAAGAAEIAISAGAASSALVMKTLET